MREAALSSPALKSRALWHRKTHANAKWPVIILFLPPALLLFTLLVILPTGEAAWYSFYHWNGYGPPDKWVGTRNYELIFQNSAFTTALWNNFLIIAVSLLVQLPLAMWLAMMVTQRIKGALAFRLIFFMP
jgi:raffinose/stachyose/melibiose transport system permease protein